MVSYLRWLGCTATSRCWQVLATKLPQRPSADRRSYTPPLGWCSLQTNIVMVIQMNCVAPGWCLCVTVFATHRSFERTEPPPELGRSHRVNLLLRTARKRSWPPGNRQNIHMNAKSGTSGSASTSTSPSVCFTFMSVSRGMWSLKSSTELTRKGMWQDKTWKKQNRHRPLRRRKMEEEIL